MVLGSRTFASTSSRQADITLTIDGKEVTVPQGSFPANFEITSRVEVCALTLRYAVGSALIQACEAAGSPIPR